MTGTPTRTSPAPALIRAADVDALVVGISLLGSGGGGDAVTFAGVLRRRLGDGEIALISPDDLPAALTGGFVVPVGVVGAINVLTEKLPSGREFHDAVAAVTRWTGRRADALMAWEAGGLNGLSGLVAALDLGLPFVDADLMGRALPRLDQFTWAVRGRALTPCALAEPSGPILVVDSADATGLERTARSFVASAGGWAALALRPTEIGQGTRDTVTGSLTRALALGRAHATLEQAPAPQAVADALGGRVLATGRIVDVAREGMGRGFRRGSVAVVDTASGAVLRLEAENEFLLAILDGELTASCPDLLCVLDRRTAVPRAVERLRVGDEVMAVVLPGPEWWWQDEAIDHVSPSAFGLDAPVVRTAVAGKPVVNTGGPR
ncbi:protein of unknown function DUF917 [Actinobacteria bacterium OK074]|nr:protein of unknown function DUF917 [Actinobacteria bacterium OK074]